LGIAEHEPVLLEPGVGLADLLGTGDLVLVGGDQDEDEAGDDQADDADRDDPHDQLNPALLEGLAPPALTPLAPQALPFFSSLAHLLGEYARGPTPRAPIAHPPRLWE